MLSSAFPDDAGGCRQRRGKSESFLKYVYTSNILSETPNVSIETKMCLILSSHSWTIVHARSVAKEKDVSKSHLCVVIPYLVC